MVRLSCGYWGFTVFSIYAKRGIRLVLMPDLIHKFFATISSIQFVRIINDPSGFFTNVAIRVNNPFRDYNQTRILFPY